MDVIRRAGIYQLSKEITLTITVDNKNIVQYQLYDEAAKRILFSDNAGSTYSRWFFFWSLDKSLWAHSSDIGSFVWLKQGDGTYVKSEVWHSTDCSGPQK